jgi:hypothetical protein
MGGSKKFTKIIKYADQSLSQYADDGIKPDSRVEVIT